MAGLTAVLLRYVPSEDGPQADVLYIEPNGEEHQLQCLCRPDGKIELGEHIEPGHIQYLVERFGAPRVFSLGQEITLGQ